MLVVLVVWVKIYRMIGLETMSCSTVAGDAPSDTPRQDEGILVRDDQQVACPVVIMHHDVHGFYINITLLDMPNIRLFFPFHQSHSQRAEISHLRLFFHELLAQHPHRSRCIPIGQRLPVPRNCFAAWVLSQCYLKVTMTGPLEEEIP